MKGPRGVLLLAALLFLWNVWGYDLWAPDEPYFGEGAREMVVDGHWAVPHVNGVVTTDKPPLYFWLIALASLPGGEVTSLTARAPSALAMLAAVWLTMRLARRLGSERAATLSGLVFATTYLVWDKGRTAQIDALLCLLILVSISAFEALRASASGGRRAGLLFWTAAALAVLAKGPVGLLVPLGIALVTLAADRDLRAWRRFAPLAGPALFAAIVVAWMAVATVGGGGDYSVWGAFRQHVVDRAVHGMHHAQPFWYFAKTLPYLLLPWTGLLPAAVAVAWRLRGTGDRLLLAWAVFVVLFFSIPIEKRGLYVLPAFPALALLIARAVDALDLGAVRLSRRWATLPLGLTGALLVLAGLAVPFAARRIEVGGIAASLAPAAGLVATGAAVFGLALAGRLRPAVGATIAGAAFIYVAVATAVLPSLDPIKSAREFSELLAAETAASRAEGHEILAYRLGNLPEAFALYTPGVYTRETDDLEALAAHLASPARVFAVVDEGQIERLPPAIRDGMVVLRRREMSRRQVALVANR